MWKSNVDTFRMTYLQDSCVLNQSSVFSFRPTSKTTMSSAAGAVSGKRLSDGQVRRPLDKKKREQERERAREEKKKPLTSTVTSPYIAQSTRALTRQLSYLVGGTVHLTCIFAGKLVVLPANVNSHARISGCQSHPRCADIV